MVKKNLILSLLLLFNTSLFSMDINNTISIITEASKATEILQDEFNTLINEESEPKQEEKLNTPQITPPISSLEVNNTTALVFSPKIYELNESIEINESIELNTSISINELNSSKKSSSQEENRTLVINGLSINLDDNNSIADNGCTDSNLSTSAEGLLIFKTRIKPYCKMTGEKFAKQFIQEDWEDIYHDKEFKMEMLKACPKMEKRYRDKWTPHLYQFTIEYASDSDAIPEC